MSKYSNDYDHYDWAKFIVKSTKDRPIKPHFAAVLFGTRNEFTPAYDKYDTDRSVTVPDITYFAFPDQATLSEWIVRASKDKKEFFFFEVKRIGSVELKVHVDLDV